MADELSEAANKSLVEQNKKLLTQATPQRIGEELKTLKKLDANNDHRLQPAEATSYLTGSVQDPRIQELAAAACAPKPSAEALRLLPDAIAGRITLLQEVGGANKKLNDLQAFGLAIESSAQTYLPKPELSAKQNEEAQGVQTAGDLQVINRISELMDKDPELRRTAASLELVPATEPLKADEFCKAISEKPKGMVR